MSGKGALCFPWRETCCCTGHFVAWKALRGNRFRPSQTRWSEPPRSCGKRTEHFLQCRSGVRARGDRGPHPSPSVGARRVLSGALAVCGARLVVVAWWAGCSAVGWVHREVWSPGCGLYLVDYRRVADADAFGAYLALVSVALQDAAFEPFPCARAGHLGRCSAWPLPWLWLVLRAVALAAGYQVGTGAVRAWAVAQCARQVSGGRGCCCASRLVHGLGVRLWPAGAGSSTSP